MAVRREQVILDLEDNLTGGLARSAVAARLLDRELKGLGGTSIKTGRDLDAPVRGVDQISQSTRKAGPDIDKFSGRLRTLADVALTLGPALIPIGASTLPVLSAALVGLTAAAGGIGVTVLALKGIGDGLKALQTFQADRTAENLQALRLEMEKLGPDGAHFVRFLDDLEPQLRDLQSLARAGLLPGFEDGIDGLLDRLPQLRRLVSDLALGMGDLARDAGQSIGGDEFSAFFHYLETDARPTLEAFARSAGNVALGVGNMLVAFAPLSRDFTGGLEDATKAFARWSAGLDDNQSFQEFLDYVRESGPQVIDLIAALAGAIAGLIHAAAPLGAAAVPALTAVAKAFAAIADSPIGPPLYTAVAALVAFNRIASLTGRASASMSSGFRKLGADTTTVQSKLSLLAGRGGGIFAAVVAVGSLTDSIDRIDVSNLDRSLTALKFGDVTPTIDKVVDSISSLESKWNQVDLGKILSVDNTLFQSTGKKLADNIDEVDKSLAQLVESGNADEAATIFQKISDLAEAKGVDPEKTAGRFDAYALAVKNAAAAAGAGSGKVDEFGNAVAGSADAMDDGTSSAQRFSDALAGLNGWFDRRQALRDYKDAVHDLSKGLKDGFGRKDLANLDAAGRSILQVAEGIKDPALRSDFLAGARQSLVDLAEKAGPKAEKAIQRVITEMDSQGLTKPHLIPLSVDDKASPTLNDLGIKLRRTGDTNAKPKVSVDPGNSIGLLGQIARMINGLHDKTITVTTNQRGGVTSSAGGQSVEAPSADGGTVPKSGRPYADRYRYLLADGEEVISNRYGQADRHRGLLKAINAGRLADGGTAASTHTKRPPVTAFNVGGGPFWDVLSAADGAATGLKGLKRQLDAQQKAYDKAKSSRDAAMSRRDAISSDIQSGLAADTWADIPGSTNVWAAGAHPGGPATAASATAALQASTARARRLEAAINTLKSRGVSGAVLLDIIGKGDVERAEMMAALDAGTLSTFSGAFTENQQTLAAVSLAGGNAVEGDNIREWRKAAADELAELRDIKAAIKAADKDNVKAHHEAAQEFTAGVNGAAWHGHTRGK